MKDVRPSICRICHNFCSILVTVEGGRPVAVRGDKSNPYYQGYVCTKGSDQTEIYSSPKRLLHSMKRMPGGSYAPIPALEAIGEIGARLKVILERHGPRAVASYLGTMSGLSHPATGPALFGFMDAIQSPMRFLTLSIDQPGKEIAPSFHGHWMAPLQRYDDIDVFLLIGINPIISHYGAPMGKPLTFLKELTARGGELIVIDPRRSDTAKRATLYLQPRAGEDAAIVAAMLNVILNEDLYDKEFVANEVEGVEELRRHIAPFTPAYAAQRAGVDAEQVADVARRFARAKRAYAVAGTGPNMSGNSTLLEYLILCLHTLCGRWLRAGETVKAVPTLWKTQPRAQAKAPTHSADLGIPVGVRGLSCTPVGLPTGAAAETMLMEGAGRVRALISAGGNPVVAWPDQLRTLEALRELDLLVQIDVTMSPTARQADYVIAVKGALEMPGLTFSADACLNFPPLGYSHSHAQYAPPIVEPPAGSDLLEDWEVFYHLAKSMGLRLNLSGSPASPIPPTALDMTQQPTNEELFSLFAADARVPLEEIKAHPHGNLFPEPAVVVAPKEEGWTERLHVGSAPMMRDLDAYRASAPKVDDAYPLRLLSRRHVGVYNSAVNNPARKSLYNPAYFNPEDLAALGLTQGDTVIVESPRSSVFAIANVDPGLRKGVISMSHGYGDAPDLDDQYVRIGASTSRLIDSMTDYEPYSGQPRMSNVPVRVRKVDEGLSALRGAEERLTSESV